MKIVRLISIIGIVLTIGFMIFYVVKLQQINVKNFTFEPMVVAKYEYSNYNEYFALNDGIYRVTKNGVSKILDDGTIEWNKSFNLEKPAVYKSDKFFVVCDLEGYQFYVFSQTGFLYDKRVDKEIISGSINGIGNTVIISAKDDQFNLDVYTNDGSIIVTRNMYYKTEGYPMFAALSEDSQALVVGTTIGLGKSIQSNLTFMNLGTYGQNLTDDVTGILSYEDTIIGTGAFIDNTHFMAVGEDRLLTYVLEPTPRENSEAIMVSNQIKKVTFNHIGAYVYYGSAFAFGKDDLENQIVCYNKEGKKQFALDMKEPVEWMSGTKEYLLLTTGTEFKIFQNNRLIREHTLDKELLGVYGIQNNKYLFVYYNEYVIGKFKEEKGK